MDRLFISLTVGTHFESPAGIEIKRIAIEQSGPVIPTMHLSQFSPVKLVAHSSQLSPARPLAHASQASQQKDIHSLHTQAWQSVRLRCTAHGSQSRVTFATIIYTTSVATIITQLAITSLQDSISTKAVTFWVWHCVEQTEHDISP